MTSISPNTYLTQRLILNLTLNLNDYNSTQQVCNYILIAQKHNNTQSLKTFFIY